MEDELNLDMSKTYIYEGLEYILTGRTAQRKLVDSAPNRPRRSRRKAVIVQEEPETVTMVEIQPAPISGSVNMGGEKVWVNFNELFIVNDMIEDDETYDFNDSGC
jgi:hypothetical protein